MSTMVLATRQAIVTKLQLNKEIMILVYAVAVVNALISLSLSFGLTLSPSQQGAIQGLANALILLLAAIFHVSLNGTLSGKNVPSPPSMNLPEIPPSVSGLK